MDALNRLIGCLPVSILTYMQGLAAAQTILCSCIPVDVEAEALEGLAVGLGENPNDYLKYVKDGRIRHDGIDFEGELEKWLADRDGAK